MRSEFESAADLVRLSTVKMITDYLGATAGEEATEMAEKMVMHFANLNEAAAGVLVIDLKDPGSIRDRMQEHSQDLVNTAMAALGMVLIDAISIGARRRAARGQSGSEGEI